MGKARIMYNMTVEDMREGLKETQTIIVPVGVVEQHGYHLPLSTDIHNAQEVATRAAEETGTFVAPTVHYAFSGGMLPGTINLSPQVSSLVLMDICRSLILQGFRNIILLLGHGATENIRAAEDAALMLQRLSPETGAAIAMVRFWQLSPTYAQAMEERDFHAGKYETSLMLYWKPELVKLDRAQLDAPELAQRMREDPDAYLVSEKRVDDPNVIPRQKQDPNMQVGVMGDYSGASAEFGEIMCREAVAGLVSLVQKMESRP